MEKLTSMESFWEIIDLNNPGKTISTLLSLGIIAGSCALKFPQIISLVKNGNARGVSLFSNLVDGLGFAVSASWGYSQNLPFKTYGEAMIILAQIYVLCILIGVYNGGAALVTAVVSLAIIGAFGYALAFGFVPLNVHEGLMGAQILFTASSRIPQIIMNQKNKGTGVLSFLTFFMSFGGAGARSFTTLVSVPWEKGKLVMFATQLTTCALNAIIVLQIVVYGKGKLKKGGDEGDDAGAGANNNKKTTGGVRGSAQQASKMSAAPVDAAAAAAATGRSSRQSRKSI